MNKPKRHHWWPQVQSRSWTGDDQLVCVTKKNGTYFRTSPNNIGVKSELYTRFTDAGSKDTGIEDWFATEIDAPAVEILSFLKAPTKLVELRSKISGSDKRALKDLGHSVQNFGSYYRISADLRNNIARYIAALLVRNPNYLQKLQEFHASENRNFLSRDLALDNMLHMYQVYEEVISKSVFMLFRRVGSSEFLFSDAGVTANEPWRTGRTIPFDIHAPITPDYAIEVLPVPFEDDLSMMEVCDLTNKGVSMMNRIAVGSASRFVFSRQVPPTKFIQKNFGLPAPKSFGFRISGNRLETRFGHHYKSSG